MIQIENNYSLTPYNTFGIKTTCRYYVKVCTLQEINELLKNELFIENKRLILGGGSNILFTKDFDGIVVHIDIKGIEKIYEDEQSVIFRVGAGTIWDDFVLHTTKLNLGGIENLSLIPGTVGATPVQNIGAYGVEVKNVIELVECITIKTGEIKKFKNEECKFAYRDSIFKQEEKNNNIITHVIFKLSKKPTLTINYGNVQEELKKFNEATVSTVREAIINIRSTKLPNPQITGNAGSFFKNPTVAKTLVSQLKNKYPTLPVYPVNDEYDKLAAGWLIEQCGWKGKQIGNTAVHDKQALVLINCGNATGEEIYMLSKQIQKSVFDTFGIKLEPEVNIL